jgi:5-methylcytosine-specific restriction endonuclease McrA
VRHFVWTFASWWALKRADYKCQICGKHYSEVHHIIPLNGGERNISVLNSPCNLLVLCHNCHWSPDIHGHRTVAREQSIMSLEAL